MFSDAPELAALTPFNAALLMLTVVLGIRYLQLRPAVPDTRYYPRLAWLRAGIYFCGCLLIASSSGVLAMVVTSPLATATQLSDPAWWALTLACVLVIVIGYGVIWPMGTFTDGRRLHPLLTLLYGGVWGICQGLLFLCIWALVEASGLNVVWVAVVSYLLIGAYNGCWHHYFWDVYVSPPHNYREWNARKVLLCHTPNLVICLSYLALYGNAGIYVLLQGAALAISAYVLRFPAYGDDYRAEAGRERSISERAA